MSLYISDHVQQVRELHKPTLDQYHDFTRIKDLLQSFSNNLFEAYSKGDSKAAVEVSNHHPLFIGQQAEDILHRAFTEEDSKQTIARAYGFQEWNAIPDQQINHQFEMAIDLFVNGEREELEKLIDLSPKLLETRSDFGHHATLLHYAGSNGVEIWRQVVPSNLPEMIRMLIGKGADKDATANFYGSLYGTKVLVESSAHPKDAGIADEIIQTLSLS